MKRIFTIIAAVLLTASVFAQAPEKMSYQAVVRDASNNLVTNQIVGMQISILQGSASGTVVYSEIQTPTTNDNGLVSIEFGGGIGFDTVNWANGTYFIKTETDPTGGSVYTITGSSQLLSVPYALHAKTAESITGTVNYTETDPLFNSSVSRGITATDTTNWNNDLMGNSVFSFSTVSNVGMSYVNMDTVLVKANQIVKIEGYKKTNGVSSISLDFRSYDGVNIVAISNIRFILTNSTGGHSTHSAGNTTFNNSEMYFTGWFIPAMDMALIVRAKEYSATATGTGEAVVIITQ